MSRSKILPAVKPRAVPSWILSVWLLVPVHLVAVWSVRYFPTQDGPAHLVNALIVKDCGKP